MAAEGCLRERRIVQPVDTPGDTKTCPKCGRTLPTAEFPSGTVDCTFDECRSCQWERLSQIPKADLEKTAAHRRSPQDADPQVFARSGYRRYYGENRERVLECMRRRSTAGAEAGYIEFGAQMLKRRDPRHGAGGSHSNEDVERLYEEQQGRCFYCGKELNGQYDLDHQTPLSRGGTDWPENLCCACEWCTSRKQNKTAEEFMEYLINLRRRR